MTWEYSSLGAPLPQSQGTPVDHTRAQYPYWYTCDAHGKHIGRVYCQGDGDYVISATWPMKGTQRVTLELFNTDIELAKAEADDLLASMGWEGMS